MKKFISLVIDVLFPDPYREINRLVDEIVNPSGGAVVLNGERFSR